MDFVYKILADELKNLKIPKVFGLMSDDIAMLMSNIDQDHIQNYRVRDENYAIAMAEGYASATGQLGVAFVGYGPGVANGFHGAVYASRTGSSVLIICGDIPKLRRNPNIQPDYKSLDAKALFESQGIECISPETPETAQEGLIKAAHKAMEGKTVVYALPIDFQGEKVERKLLPDEDYQLSRPNATPTFDNADLQIAADMQDV